MVVTDENISHRAGPLLLGYLLNWYLYGVLSVQVYIYWMAFPKDSPVSRCLVYGLYVLETAQTISLTYDSFQHFVFGFANPAAVDRVETLWLNTYVFDGLVAFIVQIYFARRIRILLSGSNIIPGNIVLLSFVHLVCMIITGVICKDVSTFTGGQTASVVAGLIGIGSATIADILIAVTMVYSLSRYDTTFRETRSFVRRLCKLSLETGALIAATALIPPFLWFLCPGQNYHVTPSLVLAKLYSNSLLAALNSRVQIHGGRDTQANGATGWRTSIDVTPNPN